MTAVPADDHLTTAAKAWHDAGYCVIPSHEDGGKRPFGAWKQYQAQRPTWEQVAAWLASGRYSGIGVLTGATSGNVEMIELEGPMDAAVDRLGRVIARSAEFEQIGVPDLLADIARGCVEQSAGGGLHLFIRVVDGPARGNTKLARTHDGKVVSETRGEGGFVVVAPTPGRNGHEPGAAYLFINGGHPSRTREVTVEDRDILHQLFTLALDEYDEPEHPTPAAVPTSHHDGVSAFDAFREVSWRSILAPAGWREGPTMADGRTHWTRPGGTRFEGTSATTVEDGPMFVFSTSVDMPTEQGMSKGQVYAHLHHGGDLSAAARALAAEGYGERVSYADLPAWDSPVPVAEVVADLPEEDPYRRAVERKAAELRVLEDARQMLAEHRAGSVPTLDGVSLADLLAQPDEPVHYRVEGLWPANGRVMLAAAAKSGKTTMVAANLIPALVDGSDFLGQHAARRASGKVVLLNMEVGESTLRRWLRDAPIDNQRDVVIANLRGKASALNLGSEAGRRRFAAFLRAHDAETVILDPLAPVLASLGLDEDSNADVAAFYSYWAEALALAGVVDDVVVHHTGHAGQRSRGASRLLDEPDAIWTLTKDAEDEDGVDGFTPIGATRYLSAYGRDVELPMQALSFDAPTRALTLTGMGKQAMRQDSIRKRVLDAVSDGDPKSGNEIVRALGGKRETVLAVIREMVSDGDLDEVYGFGKYPKYAGGSRWFPVVPPIPGTTSVQVVPPPIRGNHRTTPLEPTLDDDGREPVEGGNH